MDMFIEFINIESGDCVFINKSKINSLTVNDIDCLAMFTIDGNVPRVIKLEFIDVDNLHNFIRGIKGEVYRIPKVASYESAKLDEIDKLI